MSSRALNVPYFTQVTKAKQILCQDQRYVINADPTIIIVNQYTRSLNIAVIRERKPNSLFFHLQLLKKERCLCHDARSLLFNQQAPLSPIKLY